jgi:hypothetical protein
MRARLVLLVAIAASCATQPLGPEGDVPLPNARLGPFRPLAAGEIGDSRPAPKVMDDRGSLPRDPSVIDVDGDQATPEVVGYFGTSAPPASGGSPAIDAPSTAIVRARALDGRTFDRRPVTVLEPAEAWEGGRVGQPSALRARGEVWLYYAAAGGIGLARGTDGVSFTREHGPVLGPATGGWDAGAVPSSPSVVALGDGSFRLFYEVSLGGGATAIGEARSGDGLRWERAADVPALAPSAPPAPGEDDAWDDLAVGSPFAILGVTGDGRAALRVYHGARDRKGNAVVALAARFGDAGPLERAVAPVFGAGDALGPREPCVLVRPDFTLLFATERAGKGALEAYPAVAAGVAPATVTLPPPDPR